MSLLCEQIEATLPQTMAVPDALRKLFEWIEGNNFYEDSEDGRIGYLCAINKVREAWTETERPGGTLIEFHAEKNSDEIYFISERTKGRLRVFAQTGGDGSEAAFWLDDNGVQKIVHMGSGSGSLLACVLSDNPIDFLRLIAIGYDEICWNDDYPLRPKDAFCKNDFVVKPNLKYQNWLVQEFDTTIPETALEIVNNPAEYGDENSGDPFCEWLIQNGA